MIQSNQLIDYIASGHTADLTQSVFIGSNWEDLHKEFTAMSEAIVPDLHVAIKSHIDTLYIPSINEQGSSNIISDSLYSLLATAIDEHCPDWNIVQKAVMYWHYLIELKNTAQMDFMQRAADKHRNKMVKEAQQKSGEMEIFTPDEAKEPDTDMIREMFNPSIKPPEAECN